MFGLGMGHMLLLAAIALIAIGPKQLPEVARMIGRFLNDMKKVRDEFTRTITETRDDVSKPYGEMFQSTYTPPPYQVDVAAQHAIAAVEDRVIETPNLAPVPPLVNAPPEMIAFDEHDQIAFDLSAPEASSTASAPAAAITEDSNQDRKDH